MRHEVTTDGDLVSKHQDNEIQKKKQIKQCLKEKHQSKIKGRKRKDKLSPLSVLWKKSTIQVLEDT